MSGKKFVYIFITSVIILILTIGLANYWVNPFGVFVHEDNFYSYNMTINPRTAKISYLDLHYQEYNGFILGSSGASGVSTDTLNELTNNSFYNLFYYGADLFDTEETLKYILKNYNVDHVVLPLTYSSAMDYNNNDDDLYYTMPIQVVRQSVLNYYMKYAFANPKLLVDKVISKINDSYFQQVFDVFLPSNGMYDKGLRDVEYIGSVEEYVDNIYFNNATFYHKPLAHISESLESVERMVKLCDENNVRVEIMLYPLMAPEFFNLYPDEVTAFHNGLSEIADFWDFSLSDFSYEPRYFYDPVHYRNSLGKLMLKQMYSEVSLDFGKYIKKGTTMDYEDIVRGFPKTKELTCNDKSINQLVEIKESELLVFSMNHLSDYTITGNKIEDVLKTLRDNDYVTVTKDDLIDFVYYNKPLPEKSVMLTFDGSYLSNYEIIYPLLKKYNASGIILPTGCLVGKDTAIDVTPHFTWEQAKEMLDSGYIDIGSHTYDLNQSELLEKDNTKIRPNMLPLESDSEENYIKIIREDIRIFKNYYEKALQKPLRLLSYPHGKYTKELTQILVEEGIEITFTTEEGSNKILYALPQTILNLKRYTISDDTDIQKILK